MSDKLDNTLTEQDLIVLFLCDIAEKPPEVFAQPAHAPSNENALDFVQYLFMKLDECDQAQSSQGVCEIYEECVIVFSEKIEEFSFRDPILIAWITCFTVNIFRIFATKLSDEADSSGFTYNKNNKLHKMILLGAINKFRAASPIIPPTLH